MREGEREVEPPEREGRELEPPEREGERGGAT